MKPNQHERKSRGGGLEARYAGERPDDPAPATPTTATAPATPTTAASTVTTKPDVEPSLAFKLTALDTGDSTPSDAMVQRYEQALDALEGSCKRDPNTSHGDYALTAKRLAAEQGVVVTALEVLEGVAISAEEQAALGMDCAEVYAVFTVLLTSDG